MSGTGNNATGATIFTDNTVAGGPNDVSVANLTVQQDMRVDGNFEVGTFSIDDLTVNNDLNVTDALTVGGNASADYLETTHDVNVHGSLFLDNNIVGNGLNYDRPLKRLRVDNAANVSDVLAGSMTATNGILTTTQEHDKFQVSNSDSTRVGMVHLTGASGKLNVGTTTATRCDLITNNVTRVQIQPNNGECFFFSSIESTQPLDGAVCLAGGMGVAKSINAAGTIKTTNTTASTSTTTGALVVSGGVGVAGTINAGALATSGSINTSSTTASTSTTTGALVVAGGAGIGGAVNIGGQITFGSIASSAVTSPTFVSASGASNVEFNIPSYAKRIILSYVDLSHNSGTAQSIVAQVANDGGTYSTSGYNGVTQNGLGTINLANSTGVNLWYQTILNAGIIFGTIEIAELPKSINVPPVVNTVHAMCKVKSGTNSAVYADGIGEVVVTGTYISKVRLILSAGTFDSGYVWCSYF